MNTGDIATINGRQYRVVTCWSADDDPRDTMARLTPVEPEKPPTEEEK